jgi:hypothetical protein
LIIEKIGSDFKFFYLDSNEDNIPILKEIKKIDILFEKMVRINFN